MILRNLCICFSNAVCWTLLRKRQSWALPTTITSGSVLLVIFLGDLSAWQSLRGVGEKEPVLGSKEGTWNRSSWGATLEEHWALADQEVFQT